MRVLLAVVAAVAVFASVAASASAEGRRVAPEGDVAFEYDAEMWLDGGRAAPDEPLQVTFALKQRDRDGLLHYFTAVSDPASVWYGRHLTRDEVTRFTAVAEQDLETVRAFVRRHLKAAGLPELWDQRATLSANRDFLHVVVPASVGEAMFQVTLHRLFPAARRNALHYLRAHTHYTVPAEVAEAVDFVGGLNRLPSSTTGGHAVLAGEEQTQQAQSGKLPSGNSALLLSVLGGAELTAAVVPRCSDGSLMTTLNVCPSGAEAPANVTVTVAYNVDIGSGSSKTFDVTTASCTTCDERQRQAAYGNAIHRACGSVLGGYGVTSYGNVQVCAFDLSDIKTAVNSTVTTSSAFSSAASSGSDTLVTYIEPMVTPEFITSLYSVISPGLGLGSQSVAEFLGQFYSPKDLASYLSTYNVKPSFRVNLVGPNNADDAGGEASLDIQVMQGVAPGINTTFWSTAGLRNNSQPSGPSNQEPFLAWIIALMDNAQPPLVHSSSYSDKEVVMPRAFTDRLNVEFQKAGVRGLTLFFATGDDGASGITCRMGDCSIFNPTFPPSSPYVTSVGGTQIGRAKDALGVAVEVTADSVTGSFITSGGGFSNRYPQPQYQSEAVQGYVTSADMPPPSMQYNTSMRAYPDVSAISTNFIIFLNGSKSPIGGTSASTPTTASIYSLLNEYRLASNMPAFGFINPLLYTLQTQTVPYFTDITLGNNKCSAISTNCAAYGFQATFGWDACTGLGSPVFDLLANVVVPTPGVFTASISSGKFAVTGAKLLAPKGIWSAGTQAVVELTGTIADFNVSSGVVAYKVFESGVAKQVQDGFAEYFHCSTETCFPNMPVALFLDTPDSTSTKFTLRFSFEMPDSTSSSPDFTLDVTGTDQDKLQDFHVSFTYNFTSTSL